MVESESRSDRFGTTSTLPNTTKEQNMNNPTQKEKQEAVDRCKQQIQDLQNVLFWSVLANIWSLVGFFIILVI